MNIAQNEANTFFQFGYAIHYKPRSLKIPINHREHGLKRSKMK